MIAFPFGQTLRLWRHQRRLTQEQLARRAKVSRPNLSAMERGRREVSLGTLRALAAGLDIRPGVLADGVPPETAEHPTPSLSREAIERMVDAVAFGHRLANPSEHTTATALRILLGHRTRAIHQQWSAPRTGRHAVLAAWATLSSLYGRDAIRMLADRAMERQRAHASSPH